LTEQARRTYQNIVAALQQDAKHDEALQEASHKTDEELLNQPTQCRAVEPSNSNDTLTDNDDPT